MYIYYDQFCYQFSIAGNQPFAFQTSNIPYNAGTLISTQITTYPETSNPHANIPVTINFSKIIR